MVCAKQIVCLANNRQRKIPPADFLQKGQQGRVRPGHENVVTDKNIVSTTLGDA